MTAAASLALVLTAGFVIGFHVKHRIGRAYRRRMLAEIEQIALQITALKMARDLLMADNKELREFLAVVTPDVSA